ncbi:MAG: hypothetical protein DDT42_02045 [candidate division WS2 bacterium]|uniref:Gliding motility-associated C-terminal domain-containing protein n=1 Tax=Psychracetigena formicireducens TaxID=2986056 RepID=A0A9E2BIH6_PSYF1|nr:hypothetical protein [Candidatus Psychracetigena formicireducens]
MRVFNRWGTLVYENNDYKNDWRGEVNRGLRDNVALVPDGAYFLVITLNDTNEQISKFLTIKR